MADIPFNKPCLTGDEHSYVAAAVQSGHISGDGRFSKRVQSLLEAELGCVKALLTTSCTDALEMAALLLDIRPGDEVVVPAFTFVSTVNAFVLRGARPRFCDIRRDTLNLDESKLEAHIGPRTKTIVPVHYAGIGCEMDAICEIGARRGVAIVEDNAHGLFARYRGKLLGTFGALATQSFHETKNFSCGEGGALIINEPRFLERAEVLREKGTDRSRFFRGLVDKYTWVDIGSSFLPSDLLAAYLCAQLEKRDEVQSKRRRIWETYARGLSDWARRHEIALPTVPADCEQSYHMFYLLVPTLEMRTRLLVHLKAHGIHAVFHYLPLHLSPMGRSFGGREGDCPVTEDVSDRLLRLPFYNDLSHEDQVRIISAIESFQP